MKRRLLLFIALISVSVITSAQQQKSIQSSKLNGFNAAKKQPVTKNPSDGNWQAAALLYLDKTAYHSKAISGAYAFANKKQQLSFAINGLQLKTVPFTTDSKTANIPWTSTLSLSAVGTNQYDAGLHPQRVEAKEEYLKFYYADFAIEYINNEQGLRQNFIINKKPAGNEKLAVALQFSGDLKPELYKNNVLVLEDPTTSKKILQYDDLKVWDKNHQVLEAEMQLTANNDLLLVVDDSHAAYPITIDPLTHVPDWTTSADGVLPGLLTSLQLQIDALYGYTVEGVGDVNNDGYDDVAIGAPGAIDIIAGPSTIVGAGAVFVYFGSAAGLPVMPSRVLRATTSVTNALFGYSIGSGNVTGSILAGSVNNDIIVGAPGESYSTSVAGLIPSTANVTAGKVYVFDGSQLQAGPAFPLLSIYLDGTGYFSSGIVGVLGSNLGVNALFGFSVAGTDDMDADGLAEVIVGAPGYKGIQLLDVNSGAAFVYRSGNLATNTHTQLNAPSLVSYPLLVNLGGLLFGFSVDGVGDYNKDNRPDVIVGAPGGISLVPNFLGGSAYVYSGNGAGVNAAITTQLTGTGPLLSAVPNLFGYDVKGARNAAGNRTGDIIVGAPAGNVLSNLLPGLRLKTGTVYVFAGKLTPASTELSVQSFSSPRGANLLTQLTALDINVIALFGASIDNMRDVDCDGIADLIVGEPLSTSVGLVGVNAVGGAAFIYSGLGDGTFDTTPFWTLENSVSFDAGINAGALLGNSVAGGGYTNGPFASARALVGAPGAALDFSEGIFQLGNTLGTLFNFVTGDNGLGKAYAFSFGCRLVTHPDIGVTYVNVTLNGYTNTNDEVIPGTQYGLPVPFPTNPPGGATITMSADGSYVFNATIPGVYAYAVPVCTASGDCVNSALTITVLNPNNSQQPPIVNTDIAITNSNTPVSVNSLANDEAGYIGSALFPASVTVVVAPKNGTTSVNPATGVITYTPNLNFTGQDTLIYTVCDMSMPVPLCAFAAQVYTVQNSSTAANVTLAADDFNYVGQGSPATGNVKLNDTDPEGNTQTVAALNLPVPGVGTLILNTTGDYTFLPEPGFTGPASFTYTTCDNGVPQACASATLHILVLPLVTTPVDITNFSAQQQACNAKLTWKTSGEINTSRFDVELSTDNGRTFSVIGSATARGSNSSYSFNYGMKNELAHLYRLKAVDQNGSVTYSEMLNLRSGCASGKNESYVFPSPATSVLNLRVSNNALINTIADVYDLDGKKLLTIRLGSNQAKIDVSSFTAGIYLIKLADGTTLKFIKQ